MRDVPMPTSPSTQALRDLGTTKQRVAETIRAARVEQALAEKRALDIIAEELGAISGTPWATSDRDGAPTATTHFPEPRLKYGIGVMIILGVARCKVSLFGEGPAWDGGQGYFHLPEVTVGTPEAAARLAPRLVEDVRFKLGKDILPGRIKATQP